MSYKFEKLVHLIYFIKRNYRNNTKYKRTQRDQIEVIKFAQENKSKSSQFNSRPQLKRIENTMSHNCNEYIIDHGKDK